VDLTEKIQDISRKYHKDVRVITIYTREYHASDGWEIPINTQQSLCYLQPRTIEDRAKIARDYVAKTGAKDLNLWLDNMENTTAVAFRSEPERLYIVKQGKIMYVGGKGPFAYDPWAVEECLKKDLGY